MNITASRKISRILVANRGEIAVRIIRAARDKGVETVAIFSDVDEGSLHARLADRRIGLKGNSARDTYLDQEKIIAAAIQSNCDALHPGYGFFSENATFAEAVVKAGINFIGPSPEVIALMGNKHEARVTAEKSGVPVVPGLSAGASVSAMKAFAEKVSYPVLIKAVAGGSGRGMRVVESAADFEQQLADAQAEAESSFKNREVIVEKYLASPRHIEIQVFGDQHGNVVHFGERDCSLQRRRQKIVEEAPAPLFHPRLREKMCAAAVQLAKAVKYSGAGTMEFLVEGGEEESSAFYFLEMNTRIQVEHPVTEEISRFDLVRLQLDVAEGAALPCKQKDIRPLGHAFEFRIYAEDSAKEFRPATGSLRYILRPAGPGVREDSWVESGTRISAFYDSLLSKLVVWGPTREIALERSRRALDEFLCEGLETTLGFHRWLLRKEEFLKGGLDIKWIEREYRGEKRAAEGIGPFQYAPLPSEGEQKPLERQ